MGTSTNQSSEKESRVKKILKSPFRFMVKARDFYVDGMTQLSDKVAQYDAISTLPRSFSVSGGTAGSDYRELVRGNLENRVLARDLTTKKKKQKLLKSKSVGLGRIEEDKSCHFGEDSMSGSSSSASDTDGGSRKLSRAQRKRPRKKRIKEDACCRKEIIGPLLPPAGAGEGECSRGVRQNADETGQGSNDAGVGASRMNQRRKAKKLAKEKLKPDMIKVSADDEKC